MPSSGSSARIAQGEAGLGLDRVDPGADACLERRQLVLARGARAVVARRPARRARPGRPWRRRRCRRSAGWLRPISSGSMSIWMTVWSGRELRGVPTMSTKRVPTARMTSASGRDSGSAERALGQVVAVGDRALAVAGHDDRRLEHLGERRAARRQRAGVEDAAAGVDERRLGLAEQLGGALDQVRVAGGALRAAAPAAGGRPRPRRRACPAGPRSRPGAAGRSEAGGRPRRRAPGISSGVVARAACLVTERIMPSWFGISWSSAAAELDQVGAGSGRSTQSTGELQA